MKYFHAGWRGGFGTNSERNEALNLKKIKRENL